MWIEMKENLLKELEKLHKRKELSKAVGPDYFEPGMMEYLDQSEGLYDTSTGEILVRFEAKGTRYDGRTERTGRTGSMRLCCRYDRPLCGSKI